MTARYHPAAIAFHWGLGLAILGLLGVGLYMTGLPFSPERGRWFHWHKSLGVAVLMLSALRLLWRLWHRPPPLPRSMQARMPAWQRAVHHGTHALLYIAFFAVPLSGWAYSASAGYPVAWFGVHPLPDVIPVDADLAATLKTLHHLCTYVLGALAALHIAAALKHQWLDGDHLLARMGLGRSIDTRASRP